MEREVKVFDADIRYTIDYRRVKHPRLEFKTGKLNLILPHGYENEKRLIEKHRNWVITKQKFISQAITHSNQKKIKKKSIGELKEIIAEYCNNSHLSPSRVSIKKMKSKWGSCSAKGTLTLNKLLIYLPNNLIRYVTLHELTHLKEKKHNERFWKMISKEFKNYKNKEKELFAYWFQINKEAVI